MGRAVAWSVGTAVASFALLVTACDETVEPQSVGAADATADGANPDLCATYTRVGEACNVPRDRLCFPQCATGGCFCQDGKWQCRTDFSCFADASPLADGGTTPTDDAGPDAAGDAAADAANDAPLEGAADASSDGTADGPG